MLPKIVKSYSCSAKIAKLFSRFPNSKIIATASILDMFPKTQKKGFQRLEQEPAPVMEPLFYAFMGHSQLLCVSKQTVSTPLVEIR